MRTILNKVQSFVIQGVTEIKVEDIKKLNYSFADIFQKVCGDKIDPTETYQFLMVNYGSKVDDVLAALGSELPEYIRENHPKFIAKIPQIVIKALIISHRGLK